MGNWGLRRRFKTADFGHYNHESVMFLIRTYHLSTTERVKLELGNTEHTNNVLFTYYSICNNRYFFIIPWFLFIFIFYFDYCSLIFKHFLSTQLNTSFYQLSSKLSSAKMSNIKCHSIDEVICASYRSIINSAYRYSHL